MKIALFANTDWYLYNFRLGLARALHDAGNEVFMLSPKGAIASCSNASLCGVKLTLVGEVAG